MTNEQLAILLQSYVHQLDSIINGLVEATTEIEVERELVSTRKWVGEGPEPEYAWFHFPGINNSGYEYVQSFTGDPTMLLPLKEFKEKMEAAIETLLGQDK